MFRSSSLRLAATCVSLMCVARASAQKVELKAQPFDLSQVRLLDGPFKVAQDADAKYMLSLDLDLDPFYTLAAGDPTLAPLAARFRGLHPPRFASVFECLVNAVALQQLSLAAGLTLVNRLSRTYGACSSVAAATPSTSP